MESVVLVDRSDNAVGEMEKIEAHRLGRLHRAFSVLVFRGGRLLLQQRALGKYHAAGQWANTCCGHPRPGEDLIAAAHRRLREEMGFDCPLREAFTYVYKLQFPNGLWEHEFLHVLYGEYDGDVAPDPSEVMAWEWASLEELRRDTKERPDRYAPWFPLTLERVTSPERPT